MRLVPQRISLTGAEGEANMPSIDGVEIGGVSGDGREKKGS